MRGMTLAEQRAVGGPEAGKNRHPGPVRRGVKDGGARPGAGARRRNSEAACGGFCTIAGVDGGPLYAVKDRVSIGFSPNLNDVKTVRSLAFPAGAMENLPLTLSGKACGLSAGFHEPAASRFSLQQTLIGIQKFVTKQDSQPPSGSVVESENEGIDLSTSILGKLNRSRVRVSMAETVVSTSTGDEEEEETSKPEAKQQKVKRRGSVFSKLGSYRQKKQQQQQQQQQQTKDCGKANQIAHQFVLVSCSNSTACVVCGKPIANKPALQCQNCLLNVHENLCRDQSFPCVRCHHVGVVNGDSLREKSSTLPPEGGGGGLIHLKSSASVKEKRALSVPLRTSAQVVSLSSTTTRSTSPGIMRNTAAAAVSPSINTGYFQWRRVATKLGIDKAIIEDNQKDGSRREMGDDAMAANTLVVDVHSLTELLSASVESLDDTTPEPADFDDEPDLVLTEHEPEAWSVTVDKKTLKKMSAKNIKRQDHIWELIQTEKSHYRTLKIMQRIFAFGMLRELNMSQEMVDRIFPRLDDLLEIHVTFLLSLIGAQKLSVDKSIEEIGEVLLLQFDGKMAERVKDAYGEFCSRHNEAVQYYKDLLKSDSPFQAFIKRCSRNNLCKRLNIPECILLVTQRMTKYPLLIESILKMTPDNTKERKSLEQCLSLARDILGYIDCQVDAHVKEQRLLDIYNKLDARSYAVFNGKKFKKSDLLSNKRKLLYDGSIKWMSARGKPCEVNAVILSDVLFFLTENSQKSMFFSQDNKSSVIPLSKLLVREKGDTRDSKGLYLICQSRTEPEMYEFICRSADDRKQWIKVIRDAIINCPEEGEPSESEEERKLQEAIGARLCQLIDHLHQRDQVIALQCQEKFNIALEILEIFAKDDLSSMVKSMETESDRSKVIAPETILQSILHEVSKLFTLMQPVTRSASVMRSFSSAGEHRQSASGTVLLPKRAGTFSGFEGRNRLNIHTRDSREAGNISEDEDDVHLEIANEVSRKGENPDHLANDESGQQQLEVTFTDSRDFADESSLALEAQDRVGYPPTELSLTREQCCCIAKILQHVNEIVCISTRQMTELESVRAYLTEANEKLLRLNSENERLSHERKSPNYHPDKQLEELRTLQESIQLQRSGLDRVKEEQSALMNIQKEELRQMQGDIDKQKAELKAQKEELQRQREALQRQIDLFEEQKNHRAKLFIVGGSASAGIHQHLQNADDASKLQTLMCDHTTPPDGTRPDSICHQRSASDDLLQASMMVSTQAGERARGGGVTGSSSMRRSVGSGRLEDGRPVTRIQSMSAVSSGGNMVTGALLRRDRDSKAAANLPVQLLSTTNEQKGGQVPQQLPLKLASPLSGEPAGAESGAGGPGSASASAAAASARSNRVSQRTAPHSQQPRLLGMPSSQAVHSPTGVRSPPTVAEIMGAAALPQRTSSVTVGRGVLPSNSQNLYYHPAMVAAWSGVVRTDCGSVPMRASGHPAAAAQSSFIQSPPHPHPHPAPPRLVSTQSAGNILPMKLAERPRPKSASAQQSPVAQRRVAAAAAAAATRTSPPGGGSGEELVHSTTTTTPASRNNNEKRPSHL